MILAEFYRRQATRASRNEAFVHPFMWRDRSAGQLVATFRNGSPSSETAGSRHPSTGWKSWKLAADEPPCTSTSVSNVFRAFRS